MASEAPTSVWSCCFPLATRNHRLSRERCTPNSPIHGSLNPAPKLVHDGSKVENIGPGAERHEEANGGREASRSTVHPDVRVSMRPHVHSELCERKDSVCSAIGRVRELERVTVQAPRQGTIAAVQWMRSDNKGFLTLTRPLELKQKN